jgi:hypothetical protein
MKSGFYYHQDFLSVPIPPAPFPWGMGKETFIFLQPIRRKAGIRIIKSIFKPS